MTVTMAPYYRQNVFLQSSFPWNTISFVSKSSSINVGGWTGEDVVKFRMDELKSYEERYLFIVIYLKDN